MIAVIIKELRQTAHHAWLAAFAMLLAFAAAALIVADIRGVASAWHRLLFHAGIFVLCVILVAFAAHRWKRECGDTALDLTLTTALPPWRIILGKFAALYLVIFALLLLDRAIDHADWEMLSFWKKFAIDAAFFAALASIVPGLSSVRAKRGAGFEWSGLLAFFFALPLAAQHFLALLRENGIFLHQTAAEMPFYRAIIFSLGVVLLGFLIAAAASRKPGEDRMRDLHLFYLASVWVIPALFWVFGEENWLIVQREELVSAAKLFLLASLFERSEVTLRQKKHWRFPLFATGSVFVWLWSIALMAAAFFIAPRDEGFFLELGNWCFFGSYVAIVRCVGGKWSPPCRAWSLFGVACLASIIGGFAVLNAKLACCSMAYFEFFAFDGGFFAVVFGVSVLLRAGEIRRFVKSLLK